eukprot:3397580-Pyramimonas_sp.AAC.1
MERVLKAARVMKDMGGGRAGNLGHSPSGPCAVRQERATTGQQAAAANVKCDPCAMVNASTHGTNGRGFLMDLEKALRSHAE